MRTYRSFTCGLKDCEIKHDTWYYLCPKCRASKWYQKELRTRSKETEGSDSR